MGDALTLYELAGADSELRFSPHCWKTRMALAHKHLEARYVPWRFMDIKHIASKGIGTVPVLLDGDEPIGDSWQIALHLESRYPDRPSLFGAQEAIPVTAFVNQWADLTLLPALARILLLDIHRLLDPKDQTYFRKSREARFKASLEEIVAPLEQNLAVFQQALAPLRRLLRQQPYLAGDTPAYADYCVFCFFMWARCTSNIEVLAVGDSLIAWRDRLLDAFGALAREAKIAPPRDMGDDNAR